MHAVFGELRWEEESSWWFTQLRLDSGEWLDVIVAPGEADPSTFVEQAARLFGRAMAAERKLLHEAVRARILDLYNAWRQEDEPELTAEGLEKQLQLTFVRLDAIAPLVLSYWPGDVFGGHCVDMTVDEQLRVTGVGLVG
jgi:hypothetical protein